LMASCELKGCEVATIALFDNTFDLPGWYIFLIY